MSQERLPRTDRRRLERINRERASSSSRPQPIRVASFDAVLAREDELGFLESQKTEYYKSLLFDRSLLRILGGFGQLGVEEKILRDVYLSPLNHREISTSEFIRITNSQQNVYKDISSANHVLVRNQKVYRDEDDDEIRDLLASGTETSVIELLTDKVFRMSENTALVSMQIEWIRERKRNERKAKMRMTKPLPNKSETTLVEDNQVILDKVENGSETGLFYDDELMLGGRQLYWTNRFFSTDLNCLTPLNSQSRTGAIEQISQLGRGQISIKPQSIVSAVEFHLRRDVIQRALAMRNKYGPVDNRDWVKIKRGGDRIFMNTATDNQVVVFAAGRDIVYRGF